MFVYNNCTRDARVMRQASALQNSGYEVTIIAVLDRTTVPEELRDGIRILRIERNPPHYRILGLTRRATRRGRLVRAKGRRTFGRAHLRLRRARALPRRALRALALTRARLTHFVRSAPPMAQVPLAVALSPVSVLLIASIRMLELAIKPASSEILPEGAAPTLPVRAMRRLLVVAARLADAPWNAAIWAAEALRRTLLRIHKPLMFFDYYKRASRAALVLPAGAFQAHDLNTLPVAVFAARAARAPLIYDAHELYPAISTLSPREARIWRVIERALIRRADRVMTVCESIADELASRYRIDRPLVLLNCPPRAFGGAPAAAPSLRGLAGLDGRSEPIVLYQGGFAPNRGLFALVRAAALLERGVLVLMGWGRLEPELAELVQTLGLQKRVRITGPVPPSEVLAYAAQADIGVIPYEPVGLNNTYSTPNKLFDFMMAGLPIVGSSLPELIRFIEGLDIGRTFTPGDPSAMAAAIDAILADQTAYERMRANALAASQRYCWDEESKKLLRMYEQLSV